MNNALREEWIKTKAQLDDNPRLRWGIAFIFLTGLLYVLLVVMDWRDEVESQRQQQLRLAQELQQVEQQTQWPEFLEKEQATKAQLEKRLWQASSAGQAQAELQAKIQQWAKEHELERVRVNVSQPVEVDGMKNVWQVQAQITSRFEQGAALGLLQALESHEPMLAVRQMTWRDGRSKQVSMIVSGFFTGLEQ